MNPCSWIIRDPAILENCLERLATVPLDPLWIVTAKPHKPNRTVDQNNLMWTILTLLAEHNGHSKDEMYIITTQLYLKPITVEHRDVVYEQYSTSRLKVREMSDFIERLFQLASEEGLSLPPRGQFE